ncbi:hypothetical protein VOLCADRAFT_91831 [Volvox carteri f. nagariensis]|uniref:Uncharacterized protein n=1 Tax=Volvox carteri f. nagariensis TaxID=3068 RepID=D8TY26_VOLCA|nr:uncharacterized protein VOLCADRAFT_91831 [Volvox carteri f. nagariensis]EFJ47571.1 hypothetical protein VOLCADRAFT_91831 [Volvox carteri f. nagariensis]|eukprot:XP_002951395.1 hypothetical protein VOLCADRAFT_91831 [Volvox carteri f. nagariensis]
MVNRLASGNNILVASVCWLHQNLPNTARTASRETPWWRLASLPVTMTSKYLGLRSGCMAPLSMYMRLSSMQGRPPARHPAAVSQVQGGDVRHQRQRRTHVVQH